MGLFTAPCISEVDGTVYVAGRRLYAISIDNGTELWRSEKLGLSTSAPIVVGDNLYIGGGNDRYVYGFDRKTGELVWEYATGDLIFSTPAYAEGRLIIDCHDGNVYCFVSSDDYG